MHKEPTQASQNQRHTKSAFISNSHIPTQHGLLSPAPAFSVLLALPSESLTHATSFLDPHSLLALSQVNKHLHNHVKDENTWHRAFVFQFLGIEPEGNVNGLESIMLRRTEGTWRKEYILRWSLRMRWQRSKTPTITHSPHHSVVADIHLMSENALLATSLFYGVTSRSVPLTGKVVKGFLDAAGSQQGLGIGNPNAEFAPDVSACNLASEGSTAYILWGYRSGGVAITVAPRAMDTAVRSASTFMRCAVQDQHEAVVSDVAWSENKTACISGDFQGVAKVWDAKGMRCMWTSPTNQAQMGRVSCTKVAINAGTGVVAVGYSNGAVTIWSGFGAFAEPIPGSSICEVKIVTAPEYATQAFNAATKPVLALVIDPTSLAHPRLVVANNYDPLLHRYEVHTTLKTVVHTKFGDEASGSVHSVLPCFALRAGERSFVVVGDQLGHISVYDWQASTSSARSSQHPLKRIEAHDDGAVTALAANATVLVTGSERGTTKVWDLLTLTGLKTHAAPGLARNSVAFASVKQIALTKDMMVAAIGTNVLAWKPGAVDSRTGKVVMHSPKNARTRERPTKGHVQYEIKRAIKESRRDLDYEQPRTRTVYGRERDHHSALEGLGLSEVEAVEYALMLSRDEEEQRRLSNAMETSLQIEDEGVFEADFDDTPDFRTPMVERGNIFTSWNVPSSPAGSSASRPSPPPTSRSPSTASLLSEHSRAFTSHSLPQSVPRMSWGRLQVSPQVRPEPMEAGFGSPSPESLSPSIPPPNDDDAHFPPMSRTPSSTDASIPGTPTSTGGIRRSMSGSPEWPRVLRGATPSAPETPSGGYRGAAARAPQTGPASPRARRNQETPAPALSQSRSEPGVVGGLSLLSTSLASRGGNRALASQNEDEELRLAIELSLAEARSRGENV